MEKKDEEIKIEPMESEDNMEYLSLIKNEPLHIICDNDSLTPYSVDSNEINNEIDFDKCFDEKLEGYRCPECSYYTKRKNKGDLKTHFLQHKAPSEVNVYQCALCSFKTKYNHTLKKHLNTHKNELSKAEFEIAMKNYYDYINSSKITNDEVFGFNLDECFDKNVNGFRCPHCPFFTKRRMKSDLKTHMLKHKDPSEIPMFQCNSCFYTTRYKFYIKSHLKTHNKKWYECEECSLITKCKNFFETHIHDGEDIQESAVLYCNKCRINHKVNLEKHVNLQENIGKKSPSSSEIDPLHISDSDLEGNEIDTPEIVKIEPLQLMLDTEENKFNNSIDKDVCYSNHDVKAYENQETCVDDEQNRCVKPESLDEDEDHINLIYQSEETTLEIKELNIAEGMDCDFDTSVKKYVLKPFDLENNSLLKVKMKTINNSLFTVNPKSNINVKIISDKVLSKLDLDTCFKKELHGFQCPFCPYYTKRKVKSDLKTHLLIHQHPDKVNKFKCKLCYHKTKYKVGLRNHMKTHTNLKRSSSKNKNTQITDLEHTNDTETKNDDNNFDILNLHDATHENLDISNIQLELKELNTSKKDIKKRENNFDNPNLISGNEEHVVAFHNFDSFDESNKIGHQVNGIKIIREDVLSKLDIDKCFNKDLNGYQCPVCPYYTKRKMKADLKTHLLVHQDPDTVNKYICPLCEFKTKYQSGLKRHMATHENLDISSNDEKNKKKESGPKESIFLETEVYKNNFGFSNSNIVDQEHLVTFHNFDNFIQINENAKENQGTDDEKDKDSTKIISEEILDELDFDSCFNEELHGYQCPVCPYYTKRKMKADLKTHLLIHQDPYTVQKYKCTFCLFKTKYKQGLERHLATHENLDMSSKNKKTKQQALVIKESNILEIEEVDDNSFGNSNPNIVNEENLVTYDNVDNVIQINENSQGNHITDDEKNIDNTKIISEEVLDTLNFDSCFNKELHGYQCPVCPYYTKRKMKADLKTHLLIHQDPDKAQKYKCQFCQFKTKYKQGLERHLAIHENLDISCENEQPKLDLKELNILKTEVCNNNFSNSNPKIVKEETLVTFHNFDEFSQITENEQENQRTEENINSIKIIGEEVLGTLDFDKCFNKELHGYQCPFCPYYTKRKMKSDLKTHLLIHQDRDVAEKYKCIFCQFKTKYKQGLEKHLATHEDLDISSISEKKENQELDLKESNILKAEVCDNNFGNSGTTIINEDTLVTFHNFDNFDQIDEVNQENQRTDDDENSDSIKVVGEEILDTLDLNSCFNKELNGYQCPVCPYYTKRKMKSDLKTHLLKHQDPATVQKYNCTVCQYKTRYKNGLDRHLATHGIDISSINEKNNQELDLKESNILKAEVCDNNFGNSGTTIMNEETLVTFHNFDNFSQINKIDQENQRTDDDENSDSIKVIGEEILDTLDLNSCFNKELNGYQCPVCPYYTKRKMKSDLKTHLLKHRDPATVQKYNCTVCQYKTRYKHGLDRHLATHGIDIGSEYDNKEPIVIYHNFDSLIQLNEMIQENQKTDVEEIVDTTKIISEEVLNALDFDTCFNKELNGYQCPVCPYHTKRKMKADLKTHLLIHQDPDTVNKYICSFCQFKTKYQSGLKRHMALHENLDISSSQNQNTEYAELDFKESNILDTEVCGNNVVNSNPEINNEESLVTFHNFDNFNQTSEIVVPNRRANVKDNVDRIKIISGDIVTILDMDSCFKKQLNGYKCPVCPYYTKRKMKGDLKTHLLVHQDPDTACKFRCDICQFKTKYKDGLKRHMATHENSVISTRDEDSFHPQNDKTDVEENIDNLPSPLPRHRCPSCSYYTKRSDHLKTHLLIHEDPNKVNIYKCELCPYTSKYNWGVRKHMNTHKPSEENVNVSSETENQIDDFEENASVKIVSDEVLSKFDYDKCFVEKLNGYKCPFCRYYTKRRMKCDLKTHLLTHQDPRKSKYKCKLCPFQSKYKHNFRRHLGTHKRLRGNRKKLSVSQIKSIINDCENEPTCQEEEMELEETIILQIEPSDSDFENSNQTNIANEASDFSFAEHESFEKFDVFEQINTEDEVVKHSPSMAHQGNKVAYADVIDNDSEDIDKEIKTESTDELTEEMVFPDSVDAAQASHEEIGQDIKAENPNQETKADNTNREIKPDNTNQEITAKILNQINVDGIDLKACLDKERNCYQCPICPYYTKRKTKSDLRIHLLIHADPSVANKYKCNLCSYTTKYKHSFRNHMVVHRSSDEVVTYKCTTCSFRTKHKRSIYFHRLRHEDPIKYKRFTCSLCSFRSSHKLSVTNHMKMHENTKISVAQIENDAYIYSCLDEETRRYKCPFCSYRTKRQCRTDLRMHLQTHANPAEVNRFQCTLCLFKTKYKRSLRLHYVYIHEKSDERKHQNMKYHHRLLHDDEKKVKFSCSLCSFRSQNPAEFRKHLKTHKKIKDVREPLTLTRKPCDDITDAVDTIYEDTTIKIEEEPVKMEICEDDDDSKEKISENNQESRKVSSKEILANTIPDVDQCFDTEKKVFKCPQCPYNTKRKFDLKTHYLSHKNLNEVVHFCCNVCTFRSKYKHVLKKHMVTHASMEDKSIFIFKCDFCEFVTKHTASIRKHTIINHKDKVELDIYKCSKCKFASKYKWALDRHLYLGHKSWRYHTKNIVPL